MKRDPTGGARTRHSSASGSAGVVAGWRPGPLSRPDEGPRATARAGGPHISEALPTCGTRHSDAHYNVRSRHAPSKPQQRLKVNGFVNASLARRAYSNEQDIDALFQRCFKIICIHRTAERRRGRARSSLDARAAGRAAAAASGGPSPRRASVRDARPRDRGRAGREPTRRRESRRGDARRASASRERVLERVPANRRRPCRRPVPSLQLSTLKYGMISRTRRLHEWGGVERRVARCGVGVRCAAQSSLLARRAASSRVPCAPPGRRARASVYK